MPSRKRSLPPANGDVDEAGRDGGAALLHRIRNMWQFANVCQWIYIFGKVAKIDDSVDVEEMEAACLAPRSPLLADVALAILKLVSSHRGLTHDILDDQMRKQYLSKAPGRNPFGDDEKPLKFADFDVFTKIRVLQQLTQWTMVFPERLREKMEEQKDNDQAGWRIEPYGWDRQDRIYYVLDDNRVYRLTEAPPPPSRVKAKKSRSYRSGRRSSKRPRTLPCPVDSAAESAADGETEAEPFDDGLGGQRWECIAVTLQEVRAFLQSMDKTRDENEKILRSQLELHLVPILERQEESEKKKQLQRERELLNMAKMANAKRSSRIANKAERLKQEEREREEEVQRREAEANRRREERERLKLEKERDFRTFSRQRRLQEREARRLQHEEELAQLSEDSKKASSSEGRISERRLLIEIEKNKQALKELQEEEDWVFDCVCGLYGQVDDGTHSVACERCNTWQHSKCLGISETEAEQPEFHFVCASCRRRDGASGGTPRGTIKLKLTPTGSSSAKPQAADAPVDAALAPKALTPGEGAVVPQSAHACLEPPIRPPAAQPLLSPPGAPADASTAPAPLEAPETGSQGQAGESPQVLPQGPQSSRLGHTSGATIAPTLMPDAATSPTPQQGAADITTAVKAEAASTMTTAPTETPRTRTSPGPRFAQAAGSNEVADGVTIAAPPERPRPAVGSGEQRASDPARQGQEAAGLDKGCQVAGMYSTSQRQSPFTSDEAAGVNGMKTAKPASEPLNAAPLVSPAPVIDCPTLKPTIGSQQ